MLHIISLNESETLDFKRSWKDDYLKTICSFSNDNGDILLLGVDDDKTIIGVNEADKLLEILSNKINNKLGIIPQIEKIIIDNKNIISIDVKRSYAPVSYHGSFYYRSGSVTMQLKGSELANFLLKKYGTTWDAVEIDNFSIEDIDKETINKFKNLAKNRLPYLSEETDIVEILTKLNLYNNSKLNRAAVLLFAKDPQKYFVQSFSKIGKFISDTDLIADDIIEGNLFNQVEKIIELLKIKYLKSNIYYEGIYRKEKLEYPETALREAVINALIHRDYTNNSNLQIKIFDDKLIMTNGALFPWELFIDSLKSFHPSLPNNPIIAKVFYFAGLIESWGRGTINIINDCKALNIPEPEYNYQAGFFSIIFYKKVNVPVNDRQKGILELLKNNPLLTINQISNHFKVTRLTIIRNLKKLRELNLIKRIGSDKTGHWEVINR